MKKSFLCAALLSLLFVRAGAQTGSHTDYFIVADSSYAFFTAPAGSALSAYSAPGGGHLLRKAVRGPEAAPERWAFPNTAQPAFLMVRSEVQGAKVFPLATPVFSLQNIQKETGTIPGFYCTASGRPDATPLAALWTLKDGLWKLVEEQALPADPAVLRFEGAALAGAEAAQVRFTAGKTLLHTENIFYSKSPDAGIKVFPNPAQSAFSFTTPAAGVLTLTDLYGRTVYSAPVAAGVSEIQPAALPAGSYQVYFAPIGGEKSRFQKLQFLP